MIPGGVVIAVTDTNFACIDRIRFYNGGQEVGYSTKNQNTGQFELDSQNYDDQTILCTTTELNIRSYTYRSSTRKYRRCT